MANTLTNVMPKILARGLMALRERVVMPRLVNGDYAADAAKKGDVINVPVSASKSASDVTPAATPPTPANSAPGTVAITLDNWKHSDFFLTDKELAEIDRNEHFVPLQMSEAVRALANAVNLQILGKYLRVYGYQGTAGTTPFASTVADIVGARKILNQQKAPLAERRMVLDFAAEANALALAQMSDLEKTGDAGVKIEGSLGRKFGFDWYADDQVVTHVAGTPGGTPLVNGAASAGATSVAVDGMTATTGDYHAGDIITFAGHTQTYVVTALSTADGSGEIAALPISPALVANVADNAAITLKASHVVNLAFQRDAFAFAMRPLMASTADLELGNRIMSMQDPVSGIVLRLEISRQFKQTVWDFDVLWGAELVRPELACRIAG